MSNTLNIKTSVSSENISQHKPPLSPLQTRASLDASFENHLIDPSQSVRLWVPEGSLKQMFQPRPQSTIPAVDDHGEVLGDDGWLGTALQLKKIFISVVTQSDCTGLSHLQVGRDGHVDRLP